MSGQDESRLKQFLVGGSILVTFFTAVCALLIFWRKIPGVFGESVGTFAGIISTPFFMEFSFGAAGFIIILSLNIYRRRKEDASCVEIDEKDLPIQFRTKKD